MFKIREVGVDPTLMKYIVRLGDEAIIDAETIRDIVAAVVGPEYYDCEDELDDWNMRLRAGRNLSMQMLQFDKEVIVIADGKQIQDNYGTDLKDPDYAMEHDPDHVLDITSDESFINTLQEIGLIQLDER